MFPPEPQSFLAGGTPIAFAPRGGLFAAIGIINTDILGYGLMKMMQRLWRDESGVILSAELVLIGTILVIGMIVGLVELQCAVVGELSDLGDAIGNLDQSYQTSGIRSQKTNGGTKAYTAGARYSDTADECDCNVIVVCDGANGGGEKDYNGGIN